MLVPILVLGAAALYFMTPDERRRLGRLLLSHLRRVVDIAMARHASPDPFHAALRERARWPVVTMLLVGVNAGVFAWMLWNGVTFSDQDALVTWGANFGPRTTNGEWWRLATAMFVHTGILPLAINSICLFQLGAILERLVGRVAFASVYVATGVLASAVTLAIAPHTASTGASGAVLGLHGFLLACIVWTRFRPSPVTIPMTALKTIAPMSALFVLYNGVTTNVRDAVVLAGFAGMACGVILARRVSVAQPRPSGIATVVGATMMLAAAAVLPLRGMANVRPEIERVVALEAQTEKLYESAVDRFKQGRVSAKALADVIQRDIRPDLAAARTRVEALQNVPADQQRLIAAARVYLRLRDESWRLRADALRKANMALLKQADNVEQSSLAALRQITLPDGGPHS